MFLDRWFAKVEDVFRAIGRHVPNTSPQVLEFAWLPPLDACPRCTYDLRALPEHGTCPECGLVISADGVYVALEAVSPGSQRQLVRSATVSLLLIGAVQFLLLAAEGWTLYRFVVGCLLFGAGLYRMLNPEAPTCSGVGLVPDGIEWYRGERTVKVIPWSHVHTLDYPPPPREFGMFILLIGVRGRLTKLRLPCTRDEAKAMELLRRARQLRELTGKRD